MKCQALVIWISHQVMTEAQRLDLEYTLRHGYCGFRYLHIPNATFPTHGDAAVAELFEFINQTKKSLVTDEQLVVTGIFPPHVTAAIARYWDSNGAKFPVYIPVGVPSPGGDMRNSTHMHSHWEAL